MRQKNYKHTHYANCDSKWLLNVFLGYLTEWETEIAALSGLKAKEKFT